jgi:hypothetical protein
MKAGGKAIGAAAIAAWFTSSGAAATEPAPAPAPVQTSTSASQTTVELDEVQVVGKRLYQMREDIIKAEEKFYALYNELNTDDDYDVHCTMEVPTGTRFRYRTCKTVFLAKAQEAEARYFMTGEFAPSADVVALERRVEYQDKALALINAHPELRKLIREREELERKYEETRKKRFEENGILFE